MVSSFDDIFTYSDKYLVFAGTYNGGGHSISIGTIEISDAKYSCLTVLPVISGTVHSLAIISSLKAVGTTATVTVFQGIGSSASIENCIFSLNSYFYSSPAPACLV